MIGLIAICLVISYASCVSPEASGLTCPKGIKSFSHGFQSNLYYSCEQDTEQPILKQCDAGKFYWASKSTCHATENAAKRTYADLVIFHKPALGAPIFLGDLYNSNAKKVLSGYSFWSSDTVSRNKRRRILPSTEVNIYATRSTIDRLHRSGFSSAVQTDVMGDLVWVRGSAAYLRQTLESEKEIAVILSYRATTQIDTLPVSTPKDEDFCAVSGPTHVITSVTYGVAANFIFKKTLKESETADEVTDDLKFAVNAIKTTKSEADISEAVKKIVENVRVSFFADFVSDKEPGNYKESVEMYRSLPEHVGKFPKYANSTVTMEAEMLPITNFCAGKRVTHVDVSEDILNSLSEMLGEMQKTKLKVKTLKMRKIVRDYLPLKDILHKLLKELTTFELRMKSDLKTLLPRIHRGNGSEADLISLLHRYATSPLRPDNIKMFLNNRRRELNMLRYILKPEKLAGTDIKVLNYEEASDIEIMFRKPFVLMLKFNILPSKQIVDKLLAGQTVDESHSWFNNPYDVSAMGMQFQNFVQFASVNTNSKTHGYLLVVADGKNDVITIDAQKEGLLYHYTFPQIPPKMTSLSNTHQSVTFTVTRPSNSWVTGFSVLYWRYGRQAEATSKTYQFSPKNITNFDVDGLTANTAYEFTMRYHTPMGSSVTSDSSSFFTRLCSPPRNLRITVLGADYFDIHWDPPSTCGEGLQITKYRVTVISSLDNFIRTEIVDGVRNLEVKRLQPASAYSVSIEAIADQKLFNGTRTQEISTSLPSTIPVTTRPGPPQHLSLISRAIYSGVVEWMPPKKVAAGAVIEKYLLNYVVTNNIGSVSEMGTEMSVSSSNTSYHLTDLIQGTTYSVSVKVLTTLGDSDYSAPLKFKTMYVKSEIDLMKDSLNHSVAVVEREIEKKKEELEKKIDTYDARIEFINNTPSLMVYFPRLRSDDFPVSALSGCGGTITVPGKILYPTNKPKDKYLNNEDCVWKINTGLPTTLHFTSMSFEAGHQDYVDVYDENVHIGRYDSGTPTVNTRSGNVRLKFHTDYSNVYNGFEVTITVTDTESIAAHRYYADSRAAFTGYGAPSSFTEHHTWTLPKANNSIPVCIQDCNQRHVSNNAWSEISIELGTNPLQCTCYKNPTGFEYSLSKFHYRIL